jgi:hypothetical protein
MTGTARKMIDAIIAEKAKGDKSIEKGIRVKLILGGIMVDKLTPDTPDDPALISRIKSVAASYGVHLEEKSANIKSAYTIGSSASEAVADIKKQLAGFDVRMLVFFASRETYSPCDISAEMQAAFPKAVVCGCSSHAELYNGKTLTSAVTAMAFNSEVLIDAKVEVLENLSCGINPDAAFASFDAYFKRPMSDVSYHQYGGLVLIDGLSAKEEEVMEKIGRYTNIMFTGGSASDALKFDKTYVYANGKAYTDAALLAIFETKNGIDCIKTQSVDVTDYEFTVTKAIAEKRTVLEFDNKPAAERYAEVLGVAASEIEPLLFMNPVGLVIDDDVYIRSCKKVENSAMTFFCSILEGSQINLLKVRDIIPDTKKAVEGKLNELGTISGIIDFRCVLRTLQLNNENKSESYAKIFSGIPAIGFSTYGEQLYGQVNQTSTMIVFK